jgi:hypothetical protein
MMFAAAARNGIRRTTILTTRRHASIGKYPVPEEALSAWYNM